MRTPVVADPATAAHVEADPNDQPPAGLLAAILAQPATAVAVEEADRSWTYGDLVARASGVAAALRERGVSPDQPVAVALPRSFEQCSAILGVLWVGAGYVPIDLTYPPDRIATMLADCGAAWLLTDNRVRGLPPSHAAAIDIDTIAPANPSLPTDGDDLLGYIVYTSGSTGTPKGVAMPRGPLANLVRWQVERSEPAPRTAQYAALGFDVSFQETFTTWAAGGTLVLVPTAVRADAAGLLTWLTDQRVERLFLPPVMLGELATAAGRSDRLPTALREIIVAGEALHVTAAVRSFFARLPDCTLDNQYGPSETHVVTAHRLSGPPASWPDLPSIGSAITGAALLIRDDGTLWIGGDCLARGYWNRPDLTAERFPTSGGRRWYVTGDLVRERPDGELDYLGRADHQVKIRGHRVELLEVETTLRQLPGLDGVAVIAVDAAQGVRELVAYYRSANGDLTAPLAQLAGERLPEYMRPARYLQLVELPLTPTGKIDRLRLPKPSRERPAHLPPATRPATDAERQIAAVWQQVLGFDGVGIDDRFFDLGGSSLLLTRLHLALQDALGRTFPLTDLFERPTICRFAAGVDRKPDEVASRPKTAEIAVIGMAGRFPGAVSVDELWANLLAGVESVRTFGRDELLKSGIPAEEIDRPDYVRARAPLDDADKFDAEFFGFTPREAELLDPQHRVFLEVCYHALEHAGYAPGQVGASVGVFAGCGLNTYLLANIGSDPARLRQLTQAYQTGDYATLVGNDKDYLPTRVSYALDLRGPSVSVQTACSTSLVAIAEACSALADGRCKVALAGGASISFPQVRGYVTQEGGLASTDGHCRPFDAAASGTVFGDGAGAVVLKPLADALADGDHVYAVVRGWGVSNDGADKASFLAPSVAGQAAALREAWGRADLDPATLGYLEAHGTGTPLGDPIEIAAVQQALAPASRAEPLVVGSVKGNVGHLESAAGVTGFIKAALALDRERIPGTRHFAAPNPRCGWDGLRLSGEVVAWPRGDAARRAAVTALGVGGTNAHVVLDEAPLPATPPAARTELLLLSARTPADLQALIERFDRWASTRSRHRWADVAYTLFHGRARFNYRAYAVAVPGEPLTWHHLDEPIHPASADGRVAALELAGEAWLHGSEPEWAALDPTPGARRTGLPGYPFARTKHWIAPHKPDGRPPSVAEIALPIEPPADTVLPKLQRLLADLAGMEPDEVEPAANFFDLGFDSLLMTQAALAIQKQFGVKIGFRQLLEQLSTLEALAEAVEAQRPATSPVAPAHAPLPPTPAEKPSPGFGAFQPIAKTGLEGWTDRQRAFLAALIRRTSKRTAKSKAHVQANRGHHADPRTISGFNRNWKEMVYPLVVDRSQGSRLWDIDGNEYIDLLNGYGPLLFGHSPPFVVQAMERQLHRGIEIGPMSPLAGEVAGLICAMTGMDRACFVSTGSEAVQAALRVARTVTGRSRVVTFARDYHGNFDEALLKPSPGRGSPSVPGVPAEAVGNVVVLDYGTPESLAAIKGLAAELAAVLVEPVQSRRPELQPREFLHELRAVTAAAGCVLIFDEVICGFRLHPGGAQAYYGVAADLATYGKVVGGGVPVGVLAGRTQWMAALDGGTWQYGDDSLPEAGRTFFAGTFHRYPLGLSAAHAILTHLRDAGPALQGGLNARADKLVAQFREVNQRHAVPLEVVNCGSILYFRVLDGSQDAALVFYLLRERGVYLQEGFPSYLSLAHTDDDLRAMAWAYEDSINAMVEAGFFRGPPSRTLTQPSFLEIDLTGPELPPERHLISDEQRELWLAGQMQADASRAFNESCCLTLRGPLDIGRLRRACERLLDRHEALRAAFDNEGLALTVAPTVPLPWRTIDATPAEAGALTEVEDGIAFDLAVAPLVRWTLVKLAADDHRLLMTAHHIVCDGWAYDVLLRDLARLYTAPDAVLSPAATLADRTERESAPEARERQETSRKYWRRLYRTLPDPLALPFDRPRPAARSYRGDRHTRPLPLPLAQRLRERAREFNGTPYGWLLATYQLLLARLAGQHDFTVAVPSAGQAALGLPELVSHCVRFLPLRAKLDFDASFRRFHAEVKSSLADALEHQEFGFAQLIAELPLPRTPGVPPLVSASFNVDPALSDMEFAGLTHEVGKNPKHYVNLDLHWNVVEGGDGGYTLECEYNRDLFDAATVARWAGHYEMLLAATLADPTTALGQLPLLTADERATIVRGWNQTVKPLPVPATVPALFRAQATRTPDAPAVLADGVCWTYRDMEQRANAVAHALVAAGHRPGQPVVLVANRSPALVAGLLGTQLVGGAYVPFDPLWPAERCRVLWDDLGQPLCLADLADRGQLPAGATVMPLTHAPRPDAPVGREPNDGDAAYVLFTSGSTGVPKGVSVPHRAVVRLVWNVDYVELTPRTVFAQIAPVAFDASTLELWGPLLHGGALAVFPDRVPVAETLRAFVRRHGVNALFLTTSLLNHLIDDDATAFAELEQVVSGGEAMSVDHARRLLKQFPAVRLVNGYGPTETTTFAATFTVPPDLPATWTAMPIGRPLTNTRCYVVDARGEPVPVGVEGELLIGGPGVALGYWNRPDATAERFVPDPFEPGDGFPLYRTGDRAKFRPDGTLDYLGRRDGQVKVRGFRIELGEVEAALKALPGVRAAAAVVRGTGGDKQVVAYYVPTGQPLEYAAMRKALSKSLPEYALPAHAVALDALPLTANGKLDAARLPAPQAIAPAHAGPVHDPFVQQLLGVWEEVLGVSNVSPDASFFDLGGHSLLAARMFNRIRQVTGLSAPLGLLFESPTVRQLAERLRSEAVAHPAPRLVSLRGGRGGEPLFCAPGVGGHVFNFRELAMRLPPGRPIFGLQPQGLDGLSPPLPTIDAMAADYLAAIRAEQPRGPYWLLGYSLGGLVVYEMARQLAAAGETLKLVGVIDTHAPGHPRLRPWRQRLLLHARRWSSLSVREGWRYVSERVGRRLGRHKTIYEELVRDTADLSPAIKAVIDAQDAAIRRYHPQAHRGRITLFRSVDQPAWSEMYVSDYTMGWGELVEGELDLHWVPGGHLDVFEGAGLEALVESLGKLLQ